VVHVPMPEGVVRAKVTSTAFYDPDGERLKL
jgi:sarcosine oxidase subunit alpha